MDIRGIWKVKEMRLPSPDGELESERNAPAVTGRRAGLYTR